MACGEALMIPTRTLRLDDCHDKNIIREICCVVLENGEIKSVVLNEVACKLLGLGLFSLLSGGGVRKQSED